MEMISGSKANTSRFGGQIGRVASIMLMAASLLPGQAPGGMGATPSSRAVVLPPSGLANPGGAVSAQQSASGGGGIDTVNSSFQVNGNFAGSVSTTEPGAGP